MTPYYQDDLVTIYHGDCREWLADEGAARAGWMQAVTVTDPPYGIGFAAQPTNYQRWAGMVASSWDDMTVDWLPALLQSLGGAQVVWGGNYYDLPQSRGWLAWVKPDAPPSMGSIEFAWTNLDRNARYILHSISATNAERVGHPTQKPLAVMRWTIAPLPEGVVLDPFMGSGTTLVAAKSLGRKAIGIEIEEKYCEMAAERCRQETLGLFFSPPSDVESGVQAALPLADDAA